MYSIIPPLATCNSPKNWKVRGCRLTKWEQLFKDPMKTAAAIEELYVSGF
jgi:hypothetical protein